MKRTKKKTPAKRPAKKAKEKWSAPYYAEPIAMPPIDTYFKPEVNGNKFAIVRDITLPELWCKIEQPIHVTMLEKMRPDAPATKSERKRPAALVRVIDLDDGKAKKDLAISEPLQKLFALIPLDGYVGRSYRITRHRRHERKNYLGYSVEEVSTGETGAA